jgi:hypothetical protein
MIIKDEVLSNAAVFWRIKMKKWMGAIFCLALVLLLSLFGGQWENVNAGTVPTLRNNTLPTAAATVKPLPTAAPAGPAGARRLPVLATSRAKIDPTSGGEAVFSGWGGVKSDGNVGAGAVTLDAAKVAVQYAPMRQQLYFHRPVLDVRVLDDKGKVVPELTSNLTIYFDLTSLERRVYNGWPQEINIYWFNEQSKNWELCPDVKVEDNKANGRMTCTLKAQGTFALGWPSGK